ncbi:MAG: DUF6134 family protein [Gammaproteobacteria bacterium]
MRSGTGYSRHGKPLYWLAGAALLLDSGVEAASKEWRFRVYLDDREIGYHHFLLTENGSETRLDTRAELEVTFLKIPVFSYTHENTEHWNNGCLQSIASVTDENGELYRVEGDAAADGFRVTTNSGESVLPDCVSTFAYWDRSFLQRQALLNSQTGEYVDVKVDYIGEGETSAGNTTLPAHRYRLAGEDLELELWYSPEGHWLALQSSVEGGRLLRYEIE